MTSAQEREANRRAMIEATIVALVAEAEQREIARGTILSNPDGWRAWKRQAVIDQAKREGAGWLRSQHARLGLRQPQEPERYCAECDRRLRGAWLELEDGTAYCDEVCQSGGKPTTFSEFLAKAKPEDVEAFRRIAPRLFVQHGENAGDVTSGDPDT